MPLPELQLPQTPNNEWKDAQFEFTGAWLPGQDPALIGPNNFTVLTNLRYNDKSIEGVNGYTKINTNALANYTTIDNGFHLRTDKTTNSFILVHAVNPATSIGRVYQNTTAPGSDGDFNSTAKFDISGNAYKQDAAASLEGRFSDAPQGSVVYCNGQESLIYSGFEHRVGAVFLQKDDSTAGVLDITDKVGKSTLTTDYSAFPNGSFDELVILTTRPVQGFKFYVKTANDTDATMTVKYWDGDSWENVSSGSDGTSVTSKTLAQTGVYSFTHTNSTVKLRHYNELYLYAYKVTISAGAADIYHITCDPAFNTLQNVWDGIYRQPIQFQIYNAAAPGYEDYTLQVNQSSDINVPIGAQIDGLTSSDAIYIMFEEQIAGIRLTMLGSYINKADATMTVKFWDGDSWETVTNKVDGTLDSGSAKTLNQSGLISWTPTATEQKQTLFGSLGYAYQITFGATLTGTKGSTVEVLIDICSGIPKLESISPCNFSVLYKNRLMLGGFSARGEGNRMDYSAPNAPDVFNGVETSDNGFNSLYFGGSEPLTGAIQLFNRFGASIFAMLLAFKNTEMYILTGNGPSDFEVFPVSLSVGCPAPQTINVTELALEGEGTLSRNFAIWLSHNGPMMFDGAVIAPIKGIENYFDPNSVDYINWTYISKSRAWVDPNYKEWNLLIPSGASTTADIWLVYDLMRRKWYKKSTGAASAPQCGFQVMHPTTGERFTYGGLSTGFMIQMEDGTSWAGTGINQVVRCGDFWPSGNIWDYTIIRKFKIIAKKMTSAATVYLNVNYYNNTEMASGQSVIWLDDDVVFTDGDVAWAHAVTTSMALTLSIGLQRSVRKIVDLNYAGYAHAFEMEVTTSDVEGGFQPLLWGIRYRVERKDDTATR